MLIYLIAGEQSGDVLGARLIAALRRRNPALTFAGVGGPRMAEQGLESLFPMQELAVMGLVEVLPRLRRLQRRMTETVADITARRPDLVVTIDSPGFALRLLRRIASLNIRRIHYVAPQVWAWRENRVRNYHDVWDELLCLLPFEPAFFSNHGLASRFVGHPVLESGADTGDAARFRRQHNITENQKILILLPGSRRIETTRLLPIFAGVINNLTDVIPVVIAAANVADRVRAASQTWPRPPIIVESIAEKHDAFAAASAALTKSGTSTLELALAGVPMVVTYRVNPITAAIARRLIKVDYVCMVNLLAGAPIVPELLQEACTPGSIADTLRPLLANAHAAVIQRAAFPAIMAKLRAGNLAPSDAAAHEILVSTETRSSAGRSMTRLQK
jgi:lipid-A-disaccharide synthase